MHAIKLLLTYYLNISVQAANLSDCRIESNRKKSIRQRESNRIKTFLPELECSTTLSVCTSLWPGKGKYRKFCLLSNCTICNDLGWPWEPKLLPVCTTPSSPICSKKYNTPHDTRPISAVFSPAGSPTGVDDGCEIGLLSLKGRCQWNKFLSFLDIFHRSRRYFCHAQSAQTPVVRLVVIPIKNDTVTENWAKK